MQPRSYANPASHAANAIQDVYEKIHKKVQPNDDINASVSAHDVSAHDVSAHDVSAHEVSAHEVRDPHNILTILNSMRSRL